MHFENLIEFVWLHSLPISQDLSDDSYSAHCPLTNKQGVSPSHPKVSFCLFIFNESDKSCIKMLFKQPGFVKLKMLVFSQFCLSFLTNQNTLYFFKTYLEIEKVIYDHIFDFSRLTAYGKSCSHWHQMGPLQL